MLQHTIRLNVTVDKPPIWKWQHWLIEQLKSEFPEAVSVHALPANGSGTSGLMQTILYVDRMATPKETQWASQLVTADIAEGPSTAEEYSLHIHLGDTQLEAPITCPTLTLLANARAPMVGCLEAARQPHPSVDLAATLHLPGSGTGSTPPSHIPLGHPASDDSRSVTSSLDSICARLAVQTKDLIVQLCECLPLDSASQLKLQKSPQRHPHHHASQPVAEKIPDASSSNALTTALTSAKRFASRVGNKLSATHPNPNWQIAWRRVNGHSSVVQTGEINIADFTLLPNAAGTFCGDPFLFEKNGTTFLFVEACPHATRKGVISVRELGDDDVWSEPKLALETSTHLSYPNVFERDGEIWMLPETTATNGIQLYRARHFPDDWVLEHVLIDGVCANDATIIEHGGKLWLFATTAPWRCSTWDTLCIWSADTLTGFWTPHQDNPVLIDSHFARPAGPPFKIDNKLFLPTQNCSKGYGSSLNICEIQELSDTAFRMKPHPISHPASSTVPAGLHHYHRLGDIEVIDVMF